jgi:hypothetical protein
MRHDYIGALTARELRALGDDATEIADDLIESHRTLYGIETDAYTRQRLINEVERYLSTGE